MKKSIITFLAVLLFAAFTTLSFAENVMVAGTVKAIETEKIVLTDSEGNDQEFAITEETGISEDVKAGSKVSVEAEEGKALFVEVVEED